MIGQTPKFGTVPLQDDDGPDAEAALQEYNTLHTRLISSDEALGAFPDRGEVLFMLSESDLNAYTLLRWSLDQVGPLQDLFLTSYNVNQDIIRAFSGLLDDGETERLSLAISQSVESRLPDRIAELRQMWAPRAERFRVALCWNHSKIALLDAGDEQVVITGSGNYSYNANTEQYVLFRDSDLHGWIRQDLERRCFTERMNDRHKVWGKNGE